ncbi:MAG: hypothetical protein QOH63_2226 [Acidobacteriota bacterium]|nr:hypothetical protein [Acidobacteriota bacterium]
MYCPSCGTEVTMELNYCNRCGANLSQTTNVSEQPVRVVSTSGPIWAMAIMVIFGLGIIFSGVNALARRDINGAMLAWIVLGSLGMLLGVVSLFLRHWSHIIGGSQQTERPAKRNKTVANEHRPAQLPPTRIEPVPSVTENTTRTFEPIERGR